MSVVIETTIGDITVDLFLAERPQATLNFLKLCKLKYYNYNLFHTVIHGFVAQTGDPSGAGDGGSSIWGVVEGAQKRYFEGEAIPKIKHTEPGLLSMACAGEGLIGSQFFFTLGPELQSLDVGHVVIGEVTEGHEVLRKLNEVICDEKHRPYKDVRITHTVILDDPFEDPRGFREPSRSPSPTAERLAGGRIAADEEIDDTDGKTAEEIAEMLADKEAKARATILEIVGDIPDADIAPPENVLFVCKLNPVTTDDDLQIIFSRFGKIKGCEVIRDKVSGDSLQYAFIEFEDKKSCEDAYVKMDNVLIDDRRIHVDFSQSVAKVRWRGKGKGIEYLDGSDKKSFKDIDYNDNRKGRKRAASRLRKSSSRGGSSSQSRSRSPKRRNRSPNGRPAGGRGSGRRARSPWRRSGGGGGGGGRRGKGRDRRTKLSENNSGYHDEWDGRDIRVVQGMVDYKNRPYPNTFIERNEKKGRSGGNGGGGRRNRRARSPIRLQRRSRSRDRRRSSRSRSRSSSHRKRMDALDRYQRRGRASRSPVDRRARKRSYSRSPEPRSSNRRQSRSLDREADRKRKRDHSSPVRRKVTPPRSSSNADKHKGSKKRHETDSSGSDSRCDYSSNERSKKKSKKRSSSVKKKSKKSKKYSSSGSDRSSSDSDSNADSKRRKKSKDKKKRKK